MPIIEAVIREQLYRQYFEESSDSVLVVLLPDGRISSVNKTFYQLSGYPPEEIVDESLSILGSSSSASRDGDFSRDRKLDLALLSTPGLYNDVVLIARDGSIRIVSVKVQHLTLDGQLFALAALSDDTQRQLLIRDLATKHQSLELAYTDLEQVHSQLKVSQERMAQAAKLSALGELAAGLSHELNQPLTGVRGFAQEIADLMKAPKPSKLVVRKLLSEIIINSDKMAALLSHFRNFARGERQGFEKQGETLERVNLREAAGSVLKLLDRKLNSHGIVCKIRIDENAWVLGQRHPIEQILINLVTNARDALEGCTRKREIDISAELVSDSWVLRVRDSAGGIAESLRARIFDPFFTTKSQGQGMGLGLSISYGIAHRLGGELSLESTGPQGSVFAIKIQRAQPEKKVA